MVESFEEEYNNSDTSSQNDKIQRKDRNNSQLPPFRNQSGVSSNDGRFNSADQPI